MLAPPQIGRALRGLLLAKLSVLAGCAGYADTTSAARQAYYAGDYDRAERLFSGLLTASGRDKDRPLLLLERAMVHLAAGRHDAAIHDLLAADEQLEVMDFTGDPAQIGRYLFAEDSGLYRGPPHEKILIPTLTALTYAAAGDLGRAATAANAAYSQVVRFERLRPDVHQPSPLPLLLVGLAAERAGDPQRAFEAYRQAQTIRPIGSLEPVLGRLLEENARRFGGRWQREFDRRPAGWQRPAPIPEPHGEILVVVLLGRAPIRTAARRSMTEQQRAEFVALGMQNMSHQYPGADPQAARIQFQRQRVLPMAVLEERPSRFEAVSLELAGAETLELENVLPVGEQVAAWYAANEAAAIAATLTRLSFRVAVRVGTFLAARQRTGDTLFAWLASSVVGAALEALDTPDTRCWALLPAAVLYQRRTVPAGPVELTLNLRGRGGVRREAHTLQVPPGDVVVLLRVIAD